MKKLEVMSSYIASFFSDFRGKNGLKMTKKSGQKALATFKTKVGKWPEKVGKNEFLSEIFGFVVKN